MQELNLKDIKRNLELSVNEPKTSELVTDHDFPKKMLFGDEAHFWLIKKIVALEVMRIHKPLFKHVNILKKLLLGIKLDIILPIDCRAMI